MNTPLHVNLTRDLATVSHIAAAQWLGDFIEADAEAGHLAAELVNNGTARIELVTAFNLGQPPGHRLLLVPCDGNGEPVEVAVLNCEPVEPSAAGLEARLWFYGRLSHWQQHH